MSDSSETFTPEKVNYLARLARIKTSADETERYAEQLSQILQLIEQMNRADTNDIVPLAHPNESGLRLRDDQITAQDAEQSGALRDAYLSLAPASARGLYLAPKVIAKPPK